MAETTNRYGIYEVDHTKFGGIIYPSDFNTDYRGKNHTNGSQIARRIATDAKLDMQWRKIKKGINIMASKSGYVNEKENT